MHHEHHSTPAASPPLARAWIERSILGARPTAWLAGLVAVALLIVWLLPEDADARRKRRRRVEPPLRILSIAMTPEAYIAGHGALDFTIDVKLPPDIDGTTVLEVSSLISSPSKRHTRFLRNRQPIDVFLNPPAVANQDRSETDAVDGSEPSPATSASAGAPAPPAPARRDRVLVTLSWDGTDQNREVVSGGRYDYVIRAKLLAPDGEKLRTRMVSWKKKGSIRIKPPEAAPPDEPDAAPEGESAPEPDVESAGSEDQAATADAGADAAPSQAPRAD